MRIGLAGPCALDLIDQDLPPDLRELEVYSFPLLARLANLYLERGHGVDLFVTAFDLETPRVVEVSDALTVHVGRRRRRARDRALDVFRVERSDLGRLMRASSADVLHAHWLYEFAAAGLSAGLPIVVTGHDDPWTLIRHYRHPYWWIRAVLGMSVLWRAPHVTAVAPSLARAYRILTVGARSAAVIPNGIELPDGAHGEVPAAPARFALILNGFDERKNGKAAIAAFAQARRHLPDATLAAIGTGYGPGESAELWAQEKGFAEGVAFLGRLPHQDIRRILAGGLTALVHPSNWEACSMAILEALSFGVPVIGGEASGGVAYTLDGGRAGLLVNVKRPDEIAGAMVRIARSPELGAELARGGRAACATTFSEESVVDQYEQVLGDAMRAHREASR
ncbi:glycosyltransferase family 4 protein [Demequina pelophila]|uniref:glycosyltransferase family 4 protein n=1 Tax=Demequina pelophila TaxID=1638984 RepID=UPI0007858DD7|nr:glycosyltransferase family 4 protein [Demequina pelophila]